MIQVERECGPSVSYCGTGIQGGAQAHTCPGAGGAHHQEEEHHLHHYTTIPLRLPLAPLVPLPSHVKHRVPAKARGTWRWNRRLRRRPARAPGGGGWGPGGRTSPPGEWGVPSRPEPAAAPRGGAGAGLGPSWGTTLPRVARIGYRCECFRSLISKCCCTMPVVRTRARSESCAVGWHGQIFAD